MSGLVLALAGVWVISQVLVGGAVDRLLGTTAAQAGGTASSGGAPAPNPAVPAPNPFNIVPFP
jgi:hypothetical protein